MLRFAEELLLLLLKEDAGDLAFVPESDLHHALAGAVLMDLALENRVDTDLERLMVADQTPVGDDLLDPVLARIAADPKPRDAEHWVRQVAKDGERIRAAALQRLVEAGILRSAEDGEIVPSPTVARARRYPVVDGKAEQEVRLRIMGVLFSDDVPSPRDVVVICLADACGAFERLLSKAELEDVQDRIDLVKRLDLIGQAVTRAVRDSGEERGPPAPPPVTQLPQVKGAPLIGSARAAAKDVRGFLTEQYLKRGPVFEIQLLRRKTLVLAGAEANKFAHRKGHLHFTTRLAYRGFADGLGASRVLMGMEGKDHVAMRKALAPPLSRGRYHQFLALASEVARRHVAAWPEGRPVQPLHALQSIIADQMGEILAGEPASDYLDDLVAFLETLLVTRLTKQLPMFLFARKFKKARARVEELARKTLASHQPGGPHHDSGDLISDMIDLNRRDPQLMPETDMNMAAIIPYVVGIETVANACAFALYAIMKHPGLKERVVAEADELFAGAPTTEGLKGMDVMHRVLLESLRTHPVAPVVFRDVANSFDFEGYRVPAGKPVYVATTVTHGLPEFFPDPDRFDIDRYLPDRAEHRQTYAYVPFGLGMHRCLGGGFAEAQIMLTVAAVVHAAELELRPRNYEMEMSNVPTPRPRKSFRVQKMRMRS